MTATILARLAAIRAHYAAERDFVTQAAFNRQLTYMGYVAVLATCALDWWVSR